MKAEILSIGTEILLGNIVNTNAAYLSDRLASLGIEVYHQAVVGDNPARLKEALAEGFARADLILTTGGLGPTCDDLSKEVGAEFFGRKLIRDAEAEREMIDLMTSRGATVTPNNYKQADLPEGCIPMYNENGTAPGFILKDEATNKTLIMLPGPPSEMGPMFEKSVKPYLHQVSPSRLYTKTLHVAGTESAIEYVLKDRMNELKNPTLAPYAKTGVVDLRITAKADSQAEADALIAPVEAEIRERFGNDIFGVDDETMEGCVIDLARKNHWTITAAESCTGGLFAAKVVDAPGASDVFKESFVTYSNEAKARRLNVDEEILRHYGAVSEPCALQMAQGAAEAAGADFAAAITGIAGPTGAVAAHDDVPAKPIGLVYIGYYAKGKVDCETYVFKKKRRLNREDAVVKALNGIRVRMLQALENQ